LKTAGFPAVFAIPELRRRCVPAGWENRAALLDRAGPLC
jgi:hypothetical protein